MTPEQKVKRGHDAQTLLSNELFREAWATLDAELIRHWGATDPMQAEIRERYYHQLTGLRAVKAKLERYVADGTVAAQEIERVKQRVSGKLQPATT